jgi:hypothetical protein
VTARKNRIYIVNLGDETHLVRATTSGQAVQAIAKDMVRVRVCEAEDLIRLANAAGAGLTVTTQTAREVA